MISKNHIVYKVGDMYQTQNIDGDERLNIFNRTLMDIYMEQFQKTYDDIIAISTIGNQDVNISDLPKYLESLTLHTSDCRNIVLPETVKQHIKMIHINNANITELPDISNCNSLKRVQINFTRINQFHPNYDIPPSMMGLDLANNCISNRDNNEFRSDKLETFIQTNTNDNPKISFSDNCLDADLLQTNPIFKKINYKRQRNTKRDGFNRIEIIAPPRENIARNYLQNQHRPFVLNANENKNNNKPIVTILDTTQTVHLSSVNNSMYKSFRVIQKYIQDHEITTYNFNPSLAISMKCFGRRKLTDVNEIFAYNYPEVMQILRHDFSLTAKNTLTQKTYGETFCMVWSIFVHKYNETNNIEIFERLVTELTDGKGVCFTGKYNRLINSLVGIIDGVQVGISENEEFQFEFDRIIKRLTKENTAIEAIPVSPSNEYEIYERKCEAFRQAVCEAREVIKISSPTIQNKYDWLDALFDYEPDVKIITIDGIQYQLDYDGILRAVDSYDVIGECKFYDKFTKSYIITSEIIH
jgi:hypothetical protein